MNGGRRAPGIGVAWVVVLAVGVLGLSACTGDDPPPQPTATATATAQPSPSVTPPVAPEEAPTPKSAEAFVKYFWDVHNYSYVTLDTALFKSISDPECTFCTSTIDDLETLKNTGSRAEGSSVQLLIAAAPPGKIGSRVLVSTVISQKPGIEIHKDGSTETFPGMPKTNSSVALSWATGQWIVHDISIDKIEKTDAPR